MSTITTFLLFVIHTFFTNTIALGPSNDLLDWIQPDSPLLPEPMNAMAVGYDSTTDSIIIIGGPTNLIIKYDITTNEYTSLGSTPNQVSVGSQSYVTIKDTLYIYTNDISHSFISTFNITSKQYDSSAIPKPNAQMWSPCLTQKDDRYLIILGGYQETQIYYTTFRIFDIVQKQWLSNGPDMIQKRMQLTCDIVNDYLYAIGGWDGLTYLSNVERININTILNINTESWSMLSDSLSVGRYGLRSAVIGDTIYAIAGTVDRIHVTTNTISTDNPLITSVGYPAVVVTNNKIFVFGGDLANGGPQTDTLQYAEYIPSTTTTTFAIETTETMQDSESFSAFEIIFMGFSVTLLFLVLCGAATLFHYKMKRSVHDDEYRTSLSQIECDAQTTTVPIKFGVETDLTINMPLAPILEETESDTIWKYKHMSKWSNNEVFDWAKSVHLGNQLHHKVLDEIRSGQCTGKDIRSLTSRQHVRDAFGIINNDALCNNILSKIVSFKPQRKGNDTFKINIFSQQKHLVLNEEVSKNETVQYIKVLYKVQSGVDANIDDIHFYYKNQLLETEKTLEQLHIVNDQHLITVKFETDGVN